MNKKLSTKDALENFSLVRGGPLYQLYLRTRLIRPPFYLCHLRIIAFCLLTWIPLLVLSVIGGTAFGGIEVPFLFDINTHTRFLGSLSLLIVAEPIVDRLIQIIVKEFLARNIVSAGDRPRFDGIIASVMKIQQSAVIELFLLAFAFSVGHWIWKEYGTLSVATWYVTTIDNHPKLNSAGYWLVFISLPLFQFLLIRWYFRIFLWYKLLWQVSRLPLHLNTLHPDKSGGLGFLATSLFAFGPVLIAHTILLAGLIANRIWHGGATLTEFYLEIIGIIAYLMLLTLMPLTFFFSHFVRAKQIGLLNYGTMATHYVNDFRHKWIDTDLKTNKILLGTPDIQSLADLANSYKVAYEMRLIPCSLRTAIQLLCLIAAPLFPLVLTLIPLNEIIMNLIKIIL